MSRFQEAVEYYQNRQFEEAYQIFSSGSDRHSVFNTAMMEIFGRGIPQDLKRAEKRLEDLLESGLKEAEEPLAALQEYLRHAEVFGRYKQEYLAEHDPAAAEGMKQAKENAAAAVSRLRQCPLFEEEEPFGIISEEDRKNIYELLASVYEDGAEDSLPKMLAVMQNAGYTKERYGLKSLTRILPQLPFIETEQNRAVFHAEGSGQPAGKISAAEDSVVLPPEDIERIYELLAAVYEDGQEDNLPKMLAVMQNAGYTKEHYGIKSLTKILPQLPFIKTDQNRAVFIARKAEEETTQPMRPKAYYYAKLGKDSEDRMFLNATNGHVYTMVKKNIPSSILESLLKGEYRWFCGNEGSYFVRPARENENYLKAEGESFLRNFHVHDQISVPLRRKTGLYCLVELGPTVSGRLDREQVQSDYESLQEGVIYTFEILSAAMDEQGHLQAALRLLGRYDTSGTLRRIEALPEPEELRRMLNVPGPLIERFRNDPDKKDVLEKAMGEPLSIMALKRYLLEVYGEQKAARRVYTTKRSDYVAIEVELNLRDGKGVPLKACMNRNEGRDSYVLALIGATDPDKEMMRQVFVPDWRRVTEELSELALPENWDYRDDTTHSRRILSNYLKYGFYKSWLDGDLYEENGYGIFNTGLVDRSYDPIYCLLEPNKDANDAFGRKWTIAYFACRGKGDKGKDLNRRISRYPLPPRYFRPEEASVLFFDTGKELYCDYVHIIGDNMKRLPREFIQYTLSYDEELMKMYEENRPLHDIRSYIMNSSRLLRDLEDGLKRAVETAVKYASWNYKTAVPMYYPRNNAISLMLPLNLVGDKAAADAALVIEKLPNGNYQGQTILTMAMAYQDARQVARPNSDWLQSDAVREDAENDEEETE